MLFHKIISTSLGIGYLGKGVGTYAAIFTCLIWYLSYAGQYDDFIIASTISTTLITILGVWSGNKIEKLWGKDHNRVVIDEVAGMCITLLFVPVTIANILIGLFLFRFFDILKPLGIRKLEKWPGGWGVMADDVLSGIYANIVLQIILFCNLI